MNYHLSSERRATFVGDVFPLWIAEESGADISKKDITFSANGDGLLLRDFKGNDRFSFSHGILITVLKPGCFTVSASVDGQTLLFTVDAHPMHRATSEEANNFYFGDMHTHTSMIHAHDLYADRTVDFQEEYLAEIKKEGLLDFGVISDHAETLNDKDFFRAFVATETADPMRTLIFPGSESEVVFHKKNRFGISLRKSGEILTMNANNYILAKDFDEFMDTFRDMPEPLVILAHPQVLGWGEPPAMWDFDFPRIANDCMKRLVCGIEVIDGRGSNLNYEQSYSYALDAGFRVSPYADGVIHENWIQNRDAYRTVILATEHSKEAFVDAIRQGRAYATESGTVQLRYSVNGKVAPADLDMADTYTFHIELDTFDGNDNALPVSLRVISDYGNTVFEASCENKKSLDFTLTSSTARYFYLRFLDKNGNRTISCPVYTGRAYDDFEKLPAVRPLDMSGFSAVEADGGADASVVINGDPFTSYHSDKQTASILIDMKEERRISALGLFAPYVLRTNEKIGNHYKLTEAVESIPADVAIYTSKDGKVFEKQADAYCRIFADENIIRFAPTDARYVRFDVLSTVGRYSGKPKYADAKAAIGNLTLFE